MSKKHKNNPYRDIYIAHHGEIPKGMQIHHIDGDANNNDINNLICLSAEEHYNIHKDEFIKWASIGGKIGGLKSKELKLGWHNPKNKKPKGYKQPDGFSERQSKRLKEEYKNGDRISWMKSGKYTNEEISNLIKSGDPGKSSRGKPSVNRGKKFNLKNRELTNQHKREAALKRHKYCCELCKKNLDGGNFSKHMKSQHQWDQNKITEFKNNIK